MLPDLRIFIAALFVTVGFVFVGLALIATLRSAQVTTVATQAPRSPVAASGLAIAAQPSGPEIPAIAVAANPVSVVQEPATQTADPPSTQPSSAEADAAPGVAEQIGRLPQAPRAEEDPGADQKRPSVVETPEHSANAAATIPSPGPDNVSPTASVIEAPVVTGSVSGPSQAVERSDQKQGLKAEPKTKGRSAKRANAGAKAAAQRARMRARAVANQNTQQGPFSDLFQTQPSARSGASIQPSRE